MNKLNYVIPVVLADKHDEPNSMETSDTEDGSIPAFESQIVFSCSNQVKAMVFHTVDSFWLESVHSLVE